MKRLTSLLLVTLMVLSTLAPSFASSSVMVEKVVFKNMTTTLRHVGIGSVRFYNDDTIIESGDIISTGTTSGETEQFLVSASSNAANEWYLLPYVVDTSKPASGAFTTYSSWVAPELDEAQELSIEFKVPKAVTKMDFVPLPDRAVDNGTTLPFVVDVYLSNGQVISYDVTPTPYTRTVQTLVFEDPSLIFDLNAQSYDLTAGDTVDVDIALLNASDIYAEDFSVQYDPQAFEFVSSSIIDTEANQIYYSDENEGLLRYIVASNGSSYGIVGDSNILRVTLKVKNFDGESIVKIVNSLVADKNGNELQPIGMEKTFTLTGQPKDVNGNEIFTLGDLAIASNLLDSSSDLWGTFTPDVDNSGAVEQTDLSIIVSMILK